MPKDDPMAMTNAERQARYKKMRHQANDGDGEAQLNCWITSQAKLALKRLGKHHGLKQREIIERLILSADEEVLHSLNDDDFDQYLSVT